MEPSRDPFQDERRKSGIQTIRAEGQDMPFVLRLDDVRRVCKDWKTFSNDDPFMIMPHSEADVRSVRQYPIETDPPDHTDYRKLVEPFFMQAHRPDYQAGMQRLTDDLVESTLLRGSVEVVRELALPLQSRSLARLLSVDESEADLWISWGTHVFREGDGVQKGSQLADYIRRKFEETEGSDGADFFSTLNRASFRGRPLTLEEKHGFANMAFAGGRDTVIHTISSIIAWFGDHPDGLEFLREDTARILPATEEFVRFVSPLTAIARRCPHGGEVAGMKIAPGGRVGLCWSSANRDERFFDKPDEVILDRARNPHVGFGFGAHHCLGAPQARLLIRCLLHALCGKVQDIRVLDARPQVETESSYSRQVGHERLTVCFRRLASPSSHGQ